MKHKFHETKCDACVKSGQSKAPAMKKLIANFPDLTIHTDIYRTIQTEPTRGKRYLSTMTRTPQQLLNARLSRHKNNMAQYMFDYIAFMVRNRKQTLK